MKVTVIQHPDGSFDLHTERGHKAGPRLLTVAPRKGDNWPIMPTKLANKDGCFVTKDAAYASALSLNMYLSYAAKHRSKSKDRGKE